jgi:two-component system response regulator HydG
MRALIVDDDRDHGESIAEILETRGHAVAIAYSGEEAVDCFRAGDFDIVLMDVKLPRMNGVEAFHACRAIRPSARVMMMTGYSVEQLVADALNDGALGVLYKPFAVARLFEVLDGLDGRDQPAADAAPAA